jgi:DNA-binding transcriptional regulator YdaS (Cro superfamily)
MEKPHVTALKRAIRIAGGSQAKFAKRLADVMKRPTLKQQTVSYWVRAGILLETEYWPAIETVTDRKVTRKDLRPDVFRPGAAA